MTQPDPSAQLTAREAAALDEVDEQRARADAAEQRFHSAEDDIAAARAAVRGGDWDALWRALGLEQERLPQMRTALDTAGEPDGLTVEQEIRAEALHAAATISAPAGYDSGEVLDIAARFESYIRYGDVDDPEPDEAERLRTGEICQPGQPFACGDYHHAGHCLRPTEDDAPGGGA